MSGVLSYSIRDSLIFTERTGQDQLRGPACCRAACGSRYRKKLHRKPWIGQLTKNNIFVSIDEWISRSRTTAKAVQEQIFDLPDTLAARYIVLTRRMLAIGPNLGEPHTKAMGSGLFELRLKGTEGIARVFYCTLIGKRIVILHSFVKKTDRTPKRELEVAQSRLKEIKHEDA